MKKTGTCAQPPALECTSTSPVKCGRVFVKPESIGSSFGVRVAAPGDLRHPDHPGPASRKRSVERQRLDARRYEE